MSALLVSWFLICYVYQIIKQCNKIISSAQACIPR